MSKRILTVLAPVVAIVAFMAIPTLAQATTAQAPAGTELKAGTKVIGQSSDLTFTAGGFKLQCAKTTFIGKITSAPQTEDVTGLLESGTLTNSFGGPCPTDGALGTTVHFTLSGLPWTLQVQEPDTTGAIIAHLTGDIKFTEQFQSIFGGSIDTCTYQASNIQFSGSTSSDVLALTGSGQFLKTLGGELCNSVLTVTGTTQLETLAGFAVTIDKS